MFVEEQARTRFLHHTACPSCGSSDANAVYSDGSTYCFSCTTYVGPERPPWGGQEVQEQPTKLITVPEDISFDFPEHVVEWLSKYNLTVADMIKHRIYYSKYRDQVVFILPHAYKHGEIGMVQVRNFRQTMNKYFNLGDREDVMPIYKAHPIPGTLIIVEDILSALCVCKAGYDGMPVLGSSMSLRKVALIKKMGYERIRVWLDSNKAGAGVGLAARLAMICDDVRSVITDLDPKCYASEAIIQHVDRKPL